MLLSCLAAPMLIGYGWLHYQKSVVRKQVKWQFLSGMNEEALVLLKFRASSVQAELHWEHSREFEFQGQMYDVVKSELKGDTMYYHCWPDQAESRLNQQIKDLVANALNNHPQQQEHQKQLTHFFKSLYLLDLEKWPVPASGSGTRKVIFPPLLVWLSQSRQPDVPPPKIG